jgi:hypothetical protein
MSAAWSFERGLAWGRAGKQGVTTIAGTGS